MSALDSDTLIEQALKRLGNQTLSSDAGIWLANILDRLYEDFKWPFLEKIATGSIAAGATSVDLPSDFDSPWDVNSFTLINSEGNVITLGFATQYDQDNISDPSLEGTPAHALINLNAMTWRPYPLPEQAYTYSIRYRYKPARQEDTYTPVFPNDKILIQAIFVEGLQHEDDERYGSELGILEKMIHSYRAKFNRQPQKSQRMRMSSRFRNPVSFR